MHRSRHATLALAVLLPLFGMIAGRSALAQEPPPRPEVANPGARTCAKECHKEIFDHKVMHGPTLTDCGGCHVQGSPDVHKFFLVAPKQELCAKCHTLPHAGSEHTPVKEGRCLECHDPHGTDRPRMLVADPKKDLCTKCHQKDFGGQKFIHGPVAVGACVVCHKPHSSDQPKLLAAPIQTLCVTCHAEVGEKANEPGMHKHGALDLGCTRCHDPHASGHKFQLKDEAPNLCLQCHAEKFNQITANAKVVHGAITEAGGCSKCHEPHASKLPSLQRTTQPGECLSCHDKVLSTPDGQKLTNMAALLQQNPDHHGPIREGMCTACHSPHAGEHFRLLAEEYPPQFYAPFNIDSFKLCFKCHIPDLVLKPSGTGLTGFRNGDKNLHFLHVNQEKGRTCRACHEVHASKHPFHIRDAVPFGSSGWMLEINFEPTPEGGSCAPGCHQQRSYSRTGAVTMPKIDAAPSGGTP